MARVLSLPRVNLRTFLKISLVVLLLLVALLIYAYWLLTRPPGKVYRTKEYEPLFSIYGYGASAAEQLRRPNDVTFDRGGNIYITDAGNQRVLVFDGRGRFLFKFGKKGQGRGEFENPVGIAVAPNGKIYVADHYLGKIAVFNKKGKILKEVRVMLPIKLAIARSRLYLTTYSHLVIYDLKSLKPVVRLGKRSRATGDFDFPNGLAVDKRGNIYVADSNNLRIQAFDRNGEFKWVEGKPAGDIFARGRRFGLPVGITLDDRGLLYLVDAFHNQIEVLTSKGKNVSLLARRGNAEGELYYPAGIAYRGNNIFALADKYNDRVQVVRITVKKPGQ